MGHNHGYHHEKAPALNVKAMAAILATLFAITFAGHTAFVSKGGGDHGKGIAATGHEAQITVYATEAECEAQTGGACFMKVCDEMSAAAGHEDICGQGYNGKGWFPGKAGDAAPVPAAVPGAH